MIPRDMLRRLVEGHAEAEAPGSSPRSGREWSRVLQLAIAIGYVLIASLSDLILPSGPFLHVVWAPAGFALAVLVRFGASWWPGVMLGAFLSWLLHGLPIAVAMPLAVGATAVAAAAAAALRKLGFSPSLYTARDALLLIGVGAVLVPAVRASLGSAAFWLTEGLHMAELPTAWMKWWAGDAIGVLLVAPLLLTWSSRPSTPLDRAGVLERWALAATLVATSVLVFGTSAALSYTLTIPIAWAALRLGPRGSSASLAVIAVIALWFVSHDSGSYAGREGLAGPLGVQLLLAALAGGSIVLTPVAMAASRAVMGLRASQRQFSQIFELAGVGIGVIDGEGRFIRSNRALEGMLGYSRAELSALRVEDVTEHEDFQRQAALLEAIGAGRSDAYEIDKRYRRKDGSMFPARLTATRLPDTEGEDGHSIGIVRDLSGQRLAEESLRSDIHAREVSEERLRQTSHMLSTLIDSAPLPIFGLDLEGRVRSWNPAAERVFGWSAEEAIGRFNPIVPAAARAGFLETIQRVLNGAPTIGLEVMRPRRDGAVLSLRINASATHAANGQVDGLIAIIEDITERISLGEQLRQAQKMEAIGQLAGGIAHDFNNLLTIILANAELLKAPDGEERGAEWAELQQAARRGAELVRKLMAFSRQRPMELKPFNLPDWMRGELPALRRLLPDAIDVTAELDEGDGLMILGDEGAVEQVLLNLVTNARDAMPQGGFMVVRVGRATLGEADRRRLGCGAPGDYVTLEVQDSGCGMSPEVKAKVFEPFFTTKGLNKGTGLGMAMVYGLVKQQQGFIEVDSAPGKGTTVRMYFPRSLAPCAPLRQAESVGVARGGQERILVVDDEDSVRQVTMRVLRKFGYHVEEARDGADALAKLRRAPTPFDLVLTDLAMPNMNGLELYAAVRSPELRLPVLLMSGHAAEESAMLQGARPDLVILSKPWSTSDLLRQVRQLLEASARP